MFNTGQRKLFGRVVHFFRTGHTIFWTPVAILSSSTIFYTLLFPEFPVLYEYFPSFLHFLLIFGFLYFISGTVFGYWWIIKSYIWKGAVEMVYEQNPFFIEMVRKQNEILRLLKSDD